MKITDCFSDEAKARAYLESLRWPDGVVCPICESREVAAYGKSMGDGWYQCRPCRAKFTVRVGSVMARSHIALRHWVHVAYLMNASKKGVSAHQVHRMTGLAYRSAWFLCHRIREAMKAEFGLLGAAGGIVEADETYFGDKAQVPHRTKRGKSGLSGKRAIVAMVERGGAVRSITVDRPDKVTLTAVVAANVSPGARLQTDESRLYADAAGLVASHETVRNASGEYVRGDVHINSAEGYFGLFKRGMRGIYQHCDERHLPRYLAEFDFRYSNRVRLGVDDYERTRRTFMGMPGKRLTYAALVGRE